MQEQDDRPLPHDLHMPDHSRGVDETAGVAVRPVGAVARPVEMGDHAEVPPAFMAVETEREMRLASAWGSGR